MIHAVGIFVLMLLKIAGIILLALLAVILALLLFILFVPVRYRIFVQNEKVLESGSLIKSLKVQAKVSWLLHFIHFVAGYGPEGISNEIYAAGIDVRRVLAWLSRRREVRGRSGKKAEDSSTADVDTKEDANVSDAQSSITKDPHAADVDLKEDANASDAQSSITKDPHAADVDLKEDANAADAQSSIIKDPHTADPELNSTKDMHTEDSHISIKEDSSIIDSRSAQNKGSGSQADSSDPDSSGSPDQGQAPLKEPRNSRNTHQDTPKTEKKRKKKNIFKEIFCSISKKLHAVRDLLLNTKEKFRTLKEKIRTLKEKIHKLLEELRSPANRRVAGHLWKEVCYLICRYKPRKVKADITFSLADPALTGEVLGLVSVLPHVYRYPYSICPDFHSDKLYIEGELMVEGKITGYVMIVILLRLFRDKEFMQVVRRLTKRA